ncbi:hypothetical protein CWC26_00410 [Pseudoalteromonas sp. S4488]|uniref:hypothetical protein n=1 Tax=unclassified Pseudoalteromonas TaxID=194690 RepID=UPI001023F14A|nr:MULTISPECIES: hypothetical protein [unclassified Pseudoalteromonas]RZF87123.1 hypothetical protein EXT43_03535 [Pseudoalteromonas sp. CO109Y]TMO33246.1 hypothetical protein CWC27_17490 [Pseudoalteromonas sp. S4491]TMO41760.1 hypothetical protein CWC26_00410 [Pseudoalteromonas sp. S4488]
MSDFTDTILKLLSALTGIKTALKLLLMSIFLIAFVFYIKVDKEIDTSILNTIVFAVSASLAFLLVELLYFFIDMNKKRKTKKAQTLKLEKQKKDFLESYNRYKPFIDPNSRVILKELSIKPYPIETDNDGLRNLLEHRFIEPLENVGLRMAFFKLNPIINNQVVSDWESEIKNELQKFESKFKNFNEVLNCMRSDLKDAPTLDGEIYDRFNIISN